MTMQDIAAAAARTQSVLRRRPSTGVREDGPCVARWAGGLRIVAGDSHGHEVATDLPAALGGTGEEVSPGWLMRAGLAACAASCIAFAAAQAGIELAELEVTARSVSDAGGLFALPDGDGKPRFPGPRDVRLEVRLRAPGVAAARLRELAFAACRSSPVQAALEAVTPVAVSIDAGD